MRGRDVDVRQERLWCSRRRYPSRRPFSPACKVSENSTAMRVIGVIDVRGGVAMHARGGVRERYEAIGDPLELARRYLDDCGVEELYVADLDAIENPTSAIRDPHVRAICERAAV